LPSNRLDFDMLLAPEIKAYGKCRFSANLDSESR
jgi:hypothetical protein